MSITLDPKLEAALNEAARQAGIPPETLALATLRARFVPLVPQDEWERRLLSLAIDCGVSIPNEALTSEGLYE